MFNFFKKNKKKATPTIRFAEHPKPKWLNYMNEQQYRTFMTTIEKYFTAKNLAINFDEGVIRVEENDLGFNNLGISNISQTCAKNELSEYEKLIYTHFEAMHTIHKFNSNFDKTVNEFSMVADYINVRVVNKNTVGVVGLENLISKEISDELLALVIYDLPDSTVNISPKMLKTWNKSEDEIFQLAKKNCLAKYPFIVQKHTFDKVEVNVFSQEHFFSPSIVLFKEEMEKYSTDHGALIIMPTRHTTMIFPIQDLQVIDAVHKLIAIAHGSYRDGPGSLTPNMYWYNQETLTNLPYQLGEKLTFSPPESFVSLLNYLQKEKAEDQDNKQPVILPRIKADYSHEIYTEDKGPFLGNPMPGGVEIPEKFKPIIKSFTADLTILFAIDTGDQYTILNQEFLEKNPNLTLEKLQAYAVQNLVKEIGDKIQIQGDINSRCMLTCGGNFEAALLLLDLWGQIHDGMGDEIYIALPTRDVLLAAAINNENKGILLDAIKGYFDKNSDFLTSKALYKKSRGSTELEIVDKAF